MGCGATVRHDTRDPVHTAATVTLPQTEEKKEAPQKIQFPELMIYSGSQTGTATRLAGELAREAQAKYDIKARAADLAAFDQAALAGSRLAIFVVATYGEGGPTDNAQRFYQWLTDDKAILNQEKDSLQTLRFGVFGCGDSSFTKTFNRMAKVTSEKLRARGAVQYCRVLDIA